MFTSCVLALGLRPAQAVNSAADDRAMSVVLVMVIPLMLVVVGGCAAFGRLHMHRHFAFARVFELQPHRKTVAVFQGLLEVDQHQVVAVGAAVHHAQLGLCGQLNGRNRAHLHHVVVHLHLVQFHALGHRRACADELIGLLARVLNAADVHRTRLAAAERWRGVGVVDF